jgi:mRNA interferase MazF
VTRAIRLAKLDKVRPVLVLTRSHALDYLASVTVAPITSTVRGIPTEVPVGAANGLDHESVVSCDNVMTIDPSRLGRLVGYLRPEQEALLCRAIIDAFDLRA